MGLYARGLRRLGHYRWMAALGPRLVTTDRKVQKRTNGRVSLMGRAFRPLLLTTTGRRSGQARVSPLIHGAADGGFVVVGTNFGRPHHPAWTANLLADPDAVVSIDGYEAHVRARLVADAGPERERLWAVMTEVWPAYDTYARRAGRPIRLFFLEPVPDPAPVPQNESGQPAT